MSDIACGAVAVISECFNDNGNTRGTVTLINDFFVIFSAVFTCRLFDDALNVVVGNVVCFCLGDNVLELEVACGIGTTLLYGDGNLTTYFCENFCFCTVGFFFFTLDGTPFVVSSHNYPPFFIKIYRNIISHTAVVFKSIL